VGRNNQGNEVDSCQEHGTVKQCAPLLTGPDFYDTQELISPSTV
jgi:hypothetical protein